MSISLVRRPACRMAEPLGTPQDPLKYYVIHSAPILKILNPKTHLAARVSGEGWQTVQRPHSADREAVAELLISTSVRGRTGIIAPTPNDCSEP